MQVQEKMDAAEYRSIEEGHLDKIVLAAKVGKFLAVEQEPRERSVIENLARVLSSDVSNVVRQTLAMEVKNCRFLPRDVAERIARDMEDVSAVFLEATEIFAERELARLVPELEEYGRAAIARRSDVPQLVSGVIAEHGGEMSVLTLLRNAGADIPEDATLIVIDRFSDREIMMETLAARPDLPIAVVESVVNYVSAECRETLIRDYGLSEDLSHMLIEQTRAAALSKILAGATVAQVTDYVRMLKKKNELEPSLILAMMENGDRRFFEVSMAELINLPVTNVRALIRNGGPTGLDQLLSCGGVSEIYYAMFKTALARLPQQPRRR